MMRFAPILPLAVLLGGCVQTETVTLRETATGQITRCEMYAETSGIAVPRGVFRRSSVRACPDGEAALAWQRLD